MRRGMMGAGPLLTLVSMLSGCALVEGNDTATATVIARSSQCELSAAGYSVQGAREAGERQALLRMARAAEAPDGGMLVLVGMGQQPTGGYAIELGDETVVLRDDVAWIVVAPVVPGPGDLVPQVLTTPCLLLHLDVDHVNLIQVADRDGARLARGELR